MTGLELLAPARNADIGIAAINCGADAVYIAGPEFGARQAAGNSLDDIRRLCLYAHRFGARVFITLNTIIYENELARARRLAEAVRDAGADALIIQDLALLGTEGIDLHASTQCAIRTPRRATFYESLGVSRLILERQLSLQQIRQIRAAVSCELEFFVHGALCVCYSGQCYLSQCVAGRSANRGECVQACRSRYDLVDSTGKTLVKDKALLSLKDYRLLERLGDLAEAGINSFKIEGRLKNEAYVRNVVREYSIALDAIVAANPDKYCRASFGRVVKGFTPDSQKTFNRGYTDLFIDGKRGKWSSMEAPKGMGEQIGSVESVLVGKNSMDLRIKPLGRGHAQKPLTLHNGDGFSVVTKEGIVGFRGDVCKGLSIHCKRVDGIAPGQPVYRNIDTAFEASMAANPCVRLIPVRVEIQANGLTLSAMAVSEDGRTANAEAIGSEPARDMTRMEEIIRSQLSKISGIFSFHVGEMQVGTALPLLSSAQLNALRRSLEGLLSKQPCQQRKPPAAATLGKDRHPALEYSYKDNIANSAAADVLKHRFGVTGLRPAYELSAEDNAELMRSKYCIKYELGLCPKHQGAKPTGDLFLVNNGRRFPLLFDCVACEMVVKRT